MSCKTKDWSNKRKILSHAIQAPCHLNVDFSYNLLKIMQTYKHKKNQYSYLLTNLKPIDRSWETNHGFGFILIIEFWFNFIFVCFFFFVSITFYEKLWFRARVRCKFAKTFCYTFYKCDFQEVMVIMWFCCVSRI